MLPARTLALARGIEHWVVETPKAARAFLKAIGHPRPLAQLVIHALPERADAAALAALLAPARAGHAVGLVSDAGAPAVADPGAALVAAAHASGIAVVPLVGPSSILLALMASGLSGQAFAFHGYLPVRESERAARLRELEADSRAHARTQIFIETPFRNAAMLAIAGRDAGAGHAARGRGRPDAADRIDRDADDRRVAGRRRGELPAQAGDLPGAGVTRPPRGHTAM